MSLAGATTQPQDQAFPQRREELAKQNAAAWDDLDPEAATGYDSSFKKNTAFIKKVKTAINEAQYKLLVRDIATLSLEKYLPEIIPAVFEGLCKISKPEDVAAALEVATALHARFKSEFSSGLLGLIFSGIDPATATPVRQRNLLRLMMEFHLIGLFRTVGGTTKDALPDRVAKRYAEIKDEDAVVIAAKEVLSYDVSLEGTLSVATGFLRRYGDQLTPKLKGLFVEYAHASFKVLQTVAADTEKLTKANKKRALRIGRILEKENAELEEQQQLYEKFHKACEYFAEVLHLEMPALATPAADVATESSVELVRTTEDVDMVWESAAERDFYTKIPTPEALPAAETQLEEDAASRMTGLLAKLSVAGDEDVPQLVAEFNLGLNNKASRQRIRRLCTESTNFSNFRIVAKFLKMNEQSLGPTINEIIVALDDKLRGQISHDKLNFRSVYFFVELVKFKLIPTHVVFHKIRRLILNIKNMHNTDILAVFFEQCGRFLLHDTDYRPFMVEMLDLLQSEQKNKNLTIHDKLSIRTLMMMIDPPEVKVERKRKILPPGERFLLHVFHTELSSSPQSATLVGSILTQCNWSSNPVAYTTLERVFSRPQDVNFDVIHNLAVVLQRYVKHDRQLLVRVVDTTVENIIRGLEIDDYKIKRDRLCDVLYLGELWNCGLVTSKLVVTMLFTIITFGHPNNQPLPGISSGFDDSLNYFRLHLCVALMRRIASTFVFPKKYFALLEYYCHCKDRPLPLELEQNLQQLYTAQSVNRCNSLAEAMAQLKLVIEEEAKPQLNVSTEVSSGTLKETSNDTNVGEDEDVDLLAGIPSEDDDDDTDDDDEEDDDEDDEEEEEDEDVEAQAELESNGEEDEDDEAEGDEELSLGEDELSESSEESDSESSSDNENFENDLVAAELDREYLRIVVDAYNKTKANSNRAIKLNVPIPRTNVLAGAPSRPVGLITRKGKNVDVRAINITDNRGFDRSKKEDEAKRHREKIMNLVLNME